MRRLLRMRVSLYVTEAEDVDRRLLNLRVSVGTAFTQLKCPV